MALLPAWNDVFGQGDDKPVLQQSIRKRKRAEDALDVALKDQTPVYNAAGGLAKVGTTLLDAYMAKKAGDDASKAWKSMFESDGTNAPVFAGLSKDQISFLQNLDPETGLSLAANYAFKAPQDKWQEVRDASGNVVGQKSSLTGEVKAYPQAPKPNYTNISPGGYLLDETGNVVFHAPDKPTQPNEFQTKFGLYKKAGYSDIDALKAATGGGGSPVAILDDSGNPVYVSPGDAIGKAPYKPAYDTSVAENVAAAKARGGKIGEASGTAQAGLPAAEQSQEYVLGLIDKVKNSPQLPSVTGIIGSNLPRIPGYNSDVLARIDQLKGQNFLEAYQNLKGGGQITEIEGKKAEDAQARLNRAQTVDEYKAALDDMSELVRQHYRVQQNKANMGTSLRSKYGLE